MPEFEYRINEKGIKRYNRIKNYYCQLALRLLISYMIERRPNPCKEDDGWVALAEAEKITVNARYLLEEWRGYDEIDRRKIKNPDRA